MLRIVGSFCFRALEHEKKKSVVQASSAKTAAQFEAFDD
jgi:hypothetical protein